MYVWVRGEAENVMLVDPCGSQRGMNRIINKRKGWRRGHSRGSLKLSLPPQLGGMMRGGGTKEGRRGGTRPEEINEDRGEAE